MKRSEARKLWQRIAAGELEDDECDSRLMEWLRSTAAAILQADALKASKRRDAIVRAAGLAYRGSDEGQRLQDLVELLVDLPLLDQDGAKREAGRGEAMRTLIQAVRAEGLCEDASDLELRKRIERCLPAKWRDRG